MRSWRNSLLRWLSAPERVIWLFALLVCAAVFGITTWRLVRAHDLALAESEVATANLARSLADHANATVREADIVLAGLVERLQVDGTSEAALGRLHRLLVARVAAVPVVRYLQVFSAAGDVLTSSADPTLPINVSDRGYFTFHRDHPDVASLLGAPIRNRVDQRWSFTVSRRFEAADGRFGGVVVAIIDCDAFERFYATFDVGAKGSIVLLNEAGTIVARRSVVNQSVVNQSMAPDPDFRGRPVTLDFWQRGAAGSGRLVSPLDGVVRVYSYQKADPAPLMVVVALSEDEIFAVWRRDAWFALGVCSATSAALGLLAWWLARQIRLRARGEAVLRRSEAQYRLLADYSTDVIIQAGPDCRRQYVSPACERLFGYRSEEMLNGHPRDSVHPDDWPVVDDFIAEILRSGQARPVNYRMRHKSGTFVWVETDGQKFDGYDGFIVTIRDATLRREAEERLQASNKRLSSANTELERLARHLARARDGAELASRAKTRFLAGISHELRTPLNGILGYAHLLRMEGGLNEVQAGRVDTMLEAGAHLLQMINRVLDLSEVESGHAQLRLSEIDPREIARACLDLVRPAATAKGLTLDFEVAHDVPPRITTDPTALRQVLVNLLGNAVKFTGWGSVRLRLRLGPDGAGLRFEVADTGPGVPAALRHRLFQEFERLGAEGDGAVEGAGLGLALSARLAAMLGGGLGHEDNPAGAGSVFWLLLPPAAGEAERSPAMAQRSGTPVVATLPTRPMWVLVVDDVAMNRDIACSILRAAGHVAVCAEDGAKALVAVEAAMFDVVLMDVRMPGMSGLEATRRIRALGGTRARVPVVALTAQAFTEQIAECLAAGMDSHLAKPFTPEALLSTVAHAAEAAEARREMGHVPEATAPGAVGPEMPVLDREAFDRTACVLPRESVATYLHTIAGRGEALRDALRQPGARMAGSDLVDAAHALAGSAGMFGLARLASAARRFEAAAERSLPDVDVAARELDAAIGVSLEELHGVIQGAV